MTAVSRPLAACPASTTIAQPARPTVTPTFADRASVAAASASAQTAVIGTSQPKVTAAAVGTAARRSRGQPERRVHREHRQRPRPAAPSGR